MTQNNFVRRNRRLGFEYTDETTGEKTFTKLSDLISALRVVNPFRIPSLPKDLQHASRNLKRPLQLKERAYIIDKVICADHFHRKMWREVKKDAALEQIPLQLLDAAQFMELDTGEIGEWVFIGTYPERELHPLECKLLASFVQKAAHKLELNAEISHCTSGVCFMASKRVNPAPECQ